MSAGRSRLMRALLVAQLAISVVLLHGAGLFVGTLQNLTRVRTGFNTENLLLASVNPELNNYQPQQILNLYERLGTRLEAIPGVRSVTMAQVGLVSHDSWSNGAMVLQGQTESLNPTAYSYELYVRPGFFETMEIPLILGRSFTPRDDTAPARVAVINEAAVRAFFPNRSPIGVRFGYDSSDNTRFEIIGVVGDTVYDELRQTHPTVFTPYGQNDPTEMTFAVRTAGDPLALAPAVRDAVREVDPTLPVFNVRSQSAQVLDSLQSERFYAGVSGLFGAIALALASIGLYGILSYSVLRRTNEIGIRMALGAARRNVVGMVLREVLQTVSIGMAVGLAVVAVAIRRMAEQATPLLFDVRVDDVSTLFTAIAVLIGVAVVAGLAPARRASRVDPLVAVRYE
jgi:predicted permease